MFIETIPHPMSLSEALERRETKEKEMLEMDPAVSAALPIPAITSISTSGPSFSNPPKSKVKSRGTNGVNGSVSAAKKESKPRERKSRGGERNGEASGSARTSSRSNRGTRAAPRDEWPEVRPAEATGHPGGAILANGASPYRYSRQPQWAANTTTMRSDDFVEDPHSHRVVSPSRDEGDGWNGGQFAGTADAYLSPPAFSPPVPNPGRTIYSQQQHP